MKKSSLDLATVIGLVGGLIIVGAAIVIGGAPLIFVNIPSVLIVILGSFFIVTMKFSFGQLKTAFTVALKAFFYKVDSPDNIIEKSQELHKIAMKQGLLQLDGAEIENEFMDKSIQLIVDGVPIEVAEAILLREQANTIARHDDGQKIFMAINDVAPAMGMIGTLIGLVQMLANMEDVSTIGPAMAVALLTTLYGAILSNMVAKPIADKLEVRSEQESKLQSMIIDTTMAIAKNQNSYMLDQTLMSYLPSFEKKKMANKAKESSSGAAA